MKEESSKFELLVPHFPKILWILIVGGALYYLLPTFAKAINDPNKDVMFAYGKASMQIVGKKLEKAQFEEGGERDSIEPDAFAMQFNSLAERINSDPQSIKNAAVLWVDDANPIRNIYEREALDELGVRVDMVTSTNDAIALIESKQVRFDAMILDLDRPDQAAASCENSFSNAGCDLLIKTAQICGDALPAIVYAAGIDQSKGTPPYAAGMTNRVDKLIHLLLDAFARRERVTASDTSNLEVAEACRGNPITIRTNGDGR